MIPTRARPWGGLAIAIAFTAGLVACGDDAAGTDPDTDSGTETDDSDSSVPSGTGPGCDMPFMLECEPEVAVACEGPSTVVDLPTPMPECSAWMVDDDAPGQFAVGTTPVTFTMTGDGMQDECTTDVVVFDDAAPTIECPAPEIFVRGSEDDVVAVPGAMATDACDEAPTVSSSSAELPEGVTEVVYTATDASGNEASCAVDLGVINAFAVPGYRVLSATIVEETGETEVTLAWEPPDGPHIDGLRVETSDAEDGPWEVVETLDAEEQLSRVTMATDAAWFRVVSVAEEGDGGATTPRQAFRVTPELYRVDDVSVPGVPFNTTLYGVVRYPTALSEGPFPLVVMLHGNHGNCRSSPNDENDFCTTTQTHDCNSGVPTPNAEGYVYLLETLAAQGFVSVSISGNALNCRDDYIRERAQLIGEHLRAWDDWNADASGPFGGTFVGAVDLSRVGLMGHSRGGDAISHVHEVLEDNPIPGLTLRSLFAVAPTDFHEGVVPESEYAVLLPSCDGDVGLLSGKNHYDRSINLDDGARRAQVFYLGGNHNFFNTEWRISEWELFGGGNDPFCNPDEDALKREQTAMLEGVMGSWFWTGLMNDDTPEAFVRADAASPTAFDAWAQSELEMRWSYAASDRLLIDDFTAPNAPATNALGGTNTFEEWFLFESCFSSNCDPFFFHVRTVARLLWEQGNVPRATFGLGGYDASDFANLSFRVVSRRSTLNTGLEEQDFVIRLSDEGGTEAEFLLSDFKTLSHLYPHSNPVEILESVRLPFAEVLELEPELDTTALSSLEFEMTALDRDGSVIVADIEFAN